ncbi:hypothetical protein ACHHYP_01747 [Achlya hypogyna]|uniref:Methylated-DNA--protein-cysteine methyltransferase n=1 Tax=Achlya hypogyna TaxID=1202772 RepID=A0A1V9ZT09_ACHHY|nr:hypothetical protein ACHHYP_01747 [Achlya hypogyna]
MVRTSKPALAAKAAANAATSASTKKIVWRGQPITLHGTCHQCPILSHMHKDLRVYKLISLIPRGKVATYGGVAKAIKSGPRGVGQALRRNPFAPGVPCHRVVNANRALHGFRGSVDPSCNDLQDKLTLLTNEGVLVADHIVDTNCMYTFTPEDIASIDKDDD